MKYYILERFINYDLYSTLLLKRGLLIKERKPLVNIYGT